MNPHPLAAMADFLDTTGYNYSVFLQAYRIGSKHAEPVQEAVARALGNKVVLGDIRSVTPTEVACEVRAAFCYGDRGAGLDPAELETKRFADVLDDVMREIDLTAEQARSIKRFDILQGYPIVPMFWEFAFLFEGRDNATVLLGIAQD
jgi:hypothetical protein